MLEAHWNKRVFQGISILSQQARELGSVKAGEGEGTTGPAQDFLLPDVAPIYLA